MPESYSAFANLVALYNTDPRAAADEAKRLSAKLTTARYEIAAIGIGYAYYLAKNDTKRELFLRHPFWTGRMKKPSRRKLLLYCIMYVYGSHKGTEAKRASDHARALQSAYEQKMPVEDFPAYIKAKGGFDGLLNDTFDGLVDESEVSVEAPLTNGMPSAKAPQSLLAQDSSEEEVDEEVTDDVDVDDDRQVPPPMPKKGRADRTKSGPNGGFALKPMPRDMLMKYLILEAKQPLFDEVLNLKVGTKRKQLTVERLSDSLEYSAHGDRVPFKRIQLSAE